MRVNKELAKRNKLTKTNRKLVGQFEYYKKQHDNYTNSIISKHEVFYSDIRRRGGKLEKENNRLILIKITGAK